MSVVCEVDTIVLEDPPTSISIVTMPEEKNSLVFCFHKCDFTVSYL